MQQLLAGFRDEQLIETVTSSKSREVLLFITLINR